MEPRSVGHHLENVLIHESTKKPLLPDAHSLDYLDVPVINDQEWFDVARHGKTRVIAVGGKGKNAISSLSRWLPPGIDLLLQTNDEQGRLQTTRHTLGQIRGNSEANL